MSLNPGQRNKGTFKKGQVSPFKGKKHKPESLVLMSKHLTGRKMPVEAVEKMKNRVITLESRRKMSESKRGEKSYQWKGGISKLNRSERQFLMGTFEYKLWRRSVFKRDDYTCIWCGFKGPKLQADHIKPWATYPELRFAIDNGRTLCVDCHKKTDTYGSKALRKSQSVGKIM